jgi:hypothetical protein
MASNAKFDWSLRQPAKNWILLRLIFIFWIAIFRAVFGAGETKEQDAGEIVAVDSGLTLPAFVEPQRQTASQEEEAEEARLEMEEEKRTLVGAQMLFANSDKV